MNNPITLTTEEPGRTYITGNSNLRIYGDYLIVDGLFFKDGKVPQVRLSNSEMAAQS